MKAPTNFSVCRTLKMIYQVRLNYGRIAMYPRSVYLGLALLCSCSGGSAPESSGIKSNQNKGVEMKMEIKVTSTALQDGGMIPSKYTCDGENISPPLEWSGAPTTTKSFALICDDPDAPGKTWVHWVLYDLNASASELPEDVKPREVLSNGAKQGTNDFQKIGYGGPCPPSGTHRYFFKLYALDAETSLRPGATKDQLLKAIEGHIVAEGQLMGKYKR
jgi:Raf kinase inhibitor-like YbhB/YbcL family protein